MATSKHRPSGREEPLQARGHGSGARQEIGDVDGMRRGRTLASPSGHGKDPAPERARATRVRSAVLPRYFLALTSPPSAARIDLGRIGALRRSMVANTATPPGGAGFAGCGKDL